MRIADIDNWRVIDNRQLIVYGPGRDDAWHLRLFSSCTGLAFSETLAFRARGTHLLCGDPGDEILLRDGRCAITSMRAISPAEAAVLLDRGVRGDIGKLPAGAAPGNDKDQEKQ